VPPRDVDALAAALRDVLRGDRRSWREIAREGQRTVQNSYAWEHHASRLIAVYDQAIGETISR